MTKDFRPGDRVRHYGQQYGAAITNGAGAVAAVQEDPRPGYTEILVYWDKPQLGGHTASFINICRLFHATG